MRCKRLLAAAAIVCLVACSPVVWSQNVEQLYEGEVEQIMEQMEDDDLSADLLETLSDLIENPVNLNDTTAMLPEWLISRQMRDRINAYISQYGELLFWDELLMVNGIDSVTVERLKLVCQLWPVEKSVPRLRDMLRYGHHNFLMGSNMQIEKAKGYTTGKYEGNPYRLYSRYRFHYRDNLSIQLSADKDAGESLFQNSHKQGFDLYSGHLMLSNIGVLKKAVMGHYRLQFGQGLTLWTGGNPYYGWGAGARRSARGICPSSPFAEYDYMQGAAATFGLPRGFDLSAFYSFVQRDANIDTAAGVALSLTRSGYHRSESEIRKRHTLGEHLYGLNFQWNRQNLHIGTTAYGTSFMLPLQPKLRQYNGDAFRGQHNLNVGLDAAWRFRRLLLYGEGAYSRGGGWAGLAGVDFLYDANTTFSILYRNYSTKYYSFYADAWNRLSSVENENGLRLAVQTRLPWQVDLLLAADIYAHPGPRYACYSPSDGYEMRFELSKSIPAWRQDIQPMTISLRYRCREYDKNKKIDNQYFTANYSRHTLYADFSFNTVYFNLRTRLGASAIASDGTLQSYGLLALQDCTFSYRKLYITARLAAFNTTSYDARLYATERDFAYEFASPALYNKGIRTYLLLRYNIYKGLTLGLKYGLSLYDGMETVGSGNDQTEGNHRQQIKAQLRYTW